MAWGYSRGFVIEHDNTVKRKIDCKDCLNYEPDDKTCTKRPLYLPEDGYNSWRNCNCFELDPTTSHFEEKKAQYERTKIKKPNSTARKDNQKNAKKKV